MERSLRLCAFGSAFLALLATACPSKEAPKAGSGSAAPGISASAPSASAAAPAPAVPAPIQVGLLEAPSLCLEDGWCWKSPLPQANFIYGLWGVGNHIWAVGKHGTILHHDGKTWLREESGVDLDLMSVSGTSPSDLWVVGAQGTVLRFDGKGWRLLRTSFTEKLNGVWASEKRAVVVGPGGLVAVCERTCVTKKSGTETELKGVWGQGDQVFAVGRHGVVVRGVGDVWSSDTLPETPYLRAVWGSSPTNVFAVGTPADPIYRFDGKAWSSVPGPTHNTLRAIGGTGEKSVWATGEFGVVAQSDGAAWTSPGRLPSDELGALWQAENGDVTVAGPGGMTFRQESGRWKGNPSP
ncbi:MAG TPA: hypothetical protein PKD61_18710, partial [Polyangiaceae bacterium]|nr:hypothetical protein [Polyangiaceae bacterium]